MEEMQSTTIKPNSCCVDDIKGVLDRLLESVSVTPCTTVGVGLRNSTGVVGDWNYTGGVGVRNFTVGVEDRNFTGGFGDWSSTGGVGDWNSTGGVEDRNSTGRVGDWNSNGGVEDRNSTGRVGDWNSTGGVGDWNSTGGVEDRNSTGVVGDWNYTGGVGDWNFIGGVEDRNSTGGVGDWNFTGGVGVRNSTGGVGDWNSTGEVGDWNSTGGVEDRSANLLKRSSYPDITVSVPFDNELERSCSVPSKRARQRGNSAQLDRSASVYSERREDTSEMPITGSISSRDRVASNDDVGRETVADVDHNLKDAGGNQPSNIQKTEEPDALSDSVLQASNQTINDFDDTDDSLDDFLPLLPTRAMSPKPMAGVLNISKLGPRIQKGSNIYDLRQDQHIGSITGRKFSRSVQASFTMARKMGISRKLDHHRGCVNCLNFNRSGSLLLSGSDDLKVVVWDWAAKSPLISFESDHSSNIFQTRFVPFTNDCMIVTTARDGLVCLSELTPHGTLKGTSKLTKHKAAVHKVAVNPESGATVLTCGEDGCVKQIDLRDRSVKMLCKVKDDRNNRVCLYGVALRPFKIHEFATCGIEPDIRVYDMRMAGDFGSTTSMGPVKTFEPPSEHPVSYGSGSEQIGEEYKPYLMQLRQASAIAYRPDGTEIIGSYHGEDIYLYKTDSTGKEPVKSYGGHRNLDTVKGVSFYGPNGEYVMSGSDCGHIFMWDNHSRQIVWYAKGDIDAAVNVIEPHPSFPIFASSGIESLVKIWEPVRKSEHLETDALRGLIQRNHAELADDHRMEELLQHRFLHLVSPSFRRIRRDLISGFNGFFHPGFSFDNDDDESLASSISNPIIYSSEDSYNEEDSRMFVLASVHSDAADTDDDISNRSTGMSHDGINDENNSRNDFVVDGIEEVLQQDGNDGYEVDEIDDMDMLRFALVDTESDDGADVVDLDDDGNDFDDGADAVDDEADDVDLDDFIIDPYSNSDEPPQGDDYLDN